MILAAIAFVLTLLLVLGAYAVLVVGPERRGRQRLRSRLGVAPQGDAAAEPLMLVKLAPAGAAAGRARAFITRLTIELRGCGIKDPERLLNRVAIGALVLMAVALIAGVPPLTVGAAATGCVVAASAWLKGMKEKRLRALEELFPQAIDLLARALRAGHSFASATAMVADELPDPVASEFRLIYEQQNFGRAMPDVLRELAERAPLMDVRFFVTAVLTQRETGGNLSQVLDNLAAVTRDRFRVNRQLRVLTAQGRLTGWILGIFPVVIATMLFIWVPSHIEMLFNDPVGNRMLIAAVSLQTIGLFLIRRINRVEY